MIAEYDLDFVVSDQRETFTAKPQCILKHLDPDLYLNSEQIVIVSGIRLCEKSTLLGNMVFIELRRRRYRVYFHRQQKECDFVCLQNNRVVTIIQVCEHLTPENKTREADGLKEDNL